MQAGPAQVPAVVAAAGMVPPVRNCKGEERARKGGFSTETGV